MLAGFSSHSGVESKRLAAKASSSSSSEKRIQCGRNRSYPPDQRFKADVLYPIPLRISNGLRQGNGALTIIDPTQGARGLRDSFPRSSVGTSVKLLNFRIFRLTIPDSRTTLINEPTQSSRARRDSFPRSPVGMASPTLRVVRPPQNTDAERPRRHSHGGPWERGRFPAFRRLIDIHEGRHDEVSVCPGSFPEKNDGG